MPKLSAEAILEDLQNVVDEAEQSSPQPVAHTIVESLADLLNPTDPGIAAESIEAPGIGMRLVKDEFSGTTWAIPADEMLDAGLLTYKSPRDIPKDPRFMYEFHPAKELPQYLLQKFVPVTRRELGLEDMPRIGTASPLDSYYVIDSGASDGGDICVKIPRELGDARHRANKRLANAAIEGVKVGVITDARGNRTIIPPSDADSRTKQSISIETVEIEPKTPEKDHLGRFKPTF